MLLDIPLCHSYSLLTGAPCAMVTSRNEAGEDNVMALAWNTIFEMGSHPKVILVFDKGHTTTANILARGTFGVSIPGTNMRREFLQSGSVRGRNVGDKFNHLGLKKLACATIEGVLVDGALAHLECKLVDRELFERTGIALAEITHARVKADYWNGTSLDTRDQPENTMHAGGAASWFARSPLKAWSEGLR